MKVEFKEKKEKKLKISFSVSKEIYERKKELEKLAKEMKVKNIQYDFEKWLIKELDSLEEALTQYTEPNEEKAPKESQE